MQDINEKIKKIGAGVVITLLAFMMLLMFLPGSIDEYTGVFTSSSLGSFQGKPISRFDYNVAYNRCSDQFRKHNFPEVIVRNCASGGIKELYTLASIGRQLAVEVSQESIEKQLFESVKSSHRRLMRTAKDEDDRLTLRELYLEALRNEPMDSKVRRANAISAVQALTANYPFPAAVLMTENFLNKIRLDISYVRYNKSSIFKNLGKNIHVTENMIKKAYKDEQSKLDADKKKPYKVRKTFIKNRLSSEQKQKAFAIIKSKLSALKSGFTIKQISRITGINHITIRGLMLNELKNVGGTNISQPLDLTQIEVIKLIINEKGKRSVGPLNIKDETLYLEIKNIKLPAIQSKPRDITEKSKQKGSYLARTLLSFIINREAERGNFSVKKLSIKR